MDSNSLVFELKYQLDIPRKETGRIRRLVTQSSITSDQLVHCQITYQAAVLQVTHRNIKHLFP